MKSVAIQLVNGALDEVYNPAMVKRIKEELSNAQVQQTELPDADHGYFTENISNPDFIQMIKEEIDFMAIDSTQGDMQI